MDGWLDRLLRQLSKLDFEWNPPLLDLLNLSPSEGNISSHLSCTAGLPKASLRVLSGFREFCNRPHTTIISISIQKPNCHIIHLSAMLPLPRSTTQVSLGWIFSSSLLFHLIQTPSSLP